MEFGLIKRTSPVSLERELPNKDLLYISYDRTIPSVNRGFSLTVNIDSNGHVVIDNHERQIPDPSTIYVHLPISEDYTVNQLPYWPHYIELTPGQRYGYLCWLRNVELPTDMGYVFLYYYGLERHLLIGGFDRAFDEIIKLRNVHKNKSFQKYSENALIHAAIMRDRIDRLMDLHEKTEVSGHSNAMFLLAYNAGLDLGVEQLLLIFYKAFTTSRKPTKEDKAIFIECLSYILMQKHGKPSFPIKDYDISKTRVAREPRFANYSFPKEIQYVEITDFYQCKSMMQDLQSLFNDTYSLYKSKKALLKSSKTPEEIAIALLKKNESRYKKLLKEKLITNHEYDILMQQNN